MKILHAKFYMNFIYECAVVIYTLIRSFLSTGNIDSVANAKILKENGKIFF